MRHARGLMALAGIAAVIGVVVISGSSGNSSAPQKDDVAPAPTLAAKTERLTNGASGNSNAPTHAKTVTATDAHGRSYSCSYGVLDQLDAAEARSNRRARILHAQRAELAKIDKQYPGRTAPAAVADHFNALAARARAQVAWTNKAIAAYNRMLADLCDPS